MKFRDPARLSPSVVARLSSVEIGKACTGHGGDRPGGDQSEEHEPRESLGEQRENADPGKNDRRHPNSRGVFRPTRAW